MYKNLIELNKQGVVSFQNVITFNMDEYVGLPKEHPESYHSFMWNNFFSHIDIKPENVNILNGNAEDVEAVKAILQQRVDDQVAGGAWYPATIEVWENSSEIVVIDNYVCLFVGADKDAQVEAFRALGQAE